MVHSGNQPEGSRKRHVSSTAGVGGEISRETSLMQMILYHLGLSVFNGGCQKAKCLLTNDKILTIKNIYEVPNHYVLHTKVFKTYSIYTELVQIVC